MSLWKIAWRSIQHRALASTLTAISMALGVALVVAVLVIHGVIDRSFRRSAQGYDLIVGAKGSRLQLVLNTVYHLQRPIGNIPYEYYQEVAFGRYAPDVELAIPVCMGGNYKGYRVVGTTPEMFSKLEYLGDKKYEFQPGGRNFKAGAFFEAVVGATVARKRGLVVGDTFSPVHGFDAEQGKEHGKSKFTIVGILAPTGTPNDRALFINIEGFYQIHEEGHAGHAAEAASAEDPTQHAAETEAEHHDDTESDPYKNRGVTAILVCTDQRPERALSVQALPKLINQGPFAQAIAPAEVVAELFEGIVGNVQLILLVLAVLVVVVAGIGILVSIYNSMNDRRHDIAVMRALGARRGTVMIVILLESILLALGGGGLGLLLGHGLTGALAPLVAEHTGVIITPWQFQLNELILIPGLIALATLAGYLPAVIAYRTDVAESLAHNP